MTNNAFPFNLDVVWEPTEMEIRNSNLVRFMHGQGFDDYAEFETWAAQDPARFWQAVLSDLGIHFDVPCTRIMDLTDGLARPRWCVGGHMNIVSSCLDKWQTTAHFEPTSQTALIWEGEGGTVRRFSYVDLHRHTGQWANALRSLGLGAGDVIGIHMPMIPETVMAFLAIMRIGAVALPLFSGFGVEALSARLRAGAAQALVTVSGFQRNGQYVSLDGVLEEVRAATPTLKHVIMVDAPEGYPGVYDARPWVSTFSHLAEAVSCPADAPCLLLYTSGTTGAPKGIVHTHCGFPVKAAQDMAHCFDVKPADVVFWYTDMGWMMGPWLMLGTLILGATILIYDGAPVYPQADRIWALCARHAVTLLGLSPTLARMLQPYGVAMVQPHDLTRLRGVGSTGSPWDPTSWHWVFQHVLGGRRPVFNYTGGTEISGGILGCSLLRPLKACSFNMAIPGMVADVVNDQGVSVVGEIGELVVRQPWIGMTRGFWQDPTDRYRDTYWQPWPNLWRHGDLAVRDAEGFWYVLGRSDDTMNVAGKRLGPTEYEQVLNSLPQVAESATVGIPDPVKEQVVVCFCVLQSNVEADDHLQTRLMDVIAERLGRPLRPAALIFVPDLPKTRNAKIMRRLLVNIYLRQPLGDTSNLENPAVLRTIADAVRGVGAADQGAACR